jgi:hypothetical protein
MDMYIIVTPKEKKDGRWDSLGSRGTGRSKF